MIDPTPNEEAAMTAGGDVAGADLESLGRSDLATLSPAEWRQLIEIVVPGDCDRLRELAGRDGSRLDGMAERIPY